MVTKTMARLFVVTWLMGSIVTPVLAQTTFNKDVLPILQKNCQTCHRPGQVAPMSFLTYESTRPWAKAIKLQVTTRQMPPWNADPRYGHFANDRSLEQADIDTIAAWVDQGAPEGPAKDMPAAIEWPGNGWQIKPDVIVNGPETAVPAHTKNEVMEWTNFVMPSGFTKDTWITSIEIKPSEPAVTHHICISFIPHRPDVKYNVPQWRDVIRDDKGIEIPQVRERRPRAVAPAPEPLPRVSDDSGQECYLPGTQALDYRPQHAGKLIPAGADILFNVHYTPNGKEVVDRPQVGFTVSNETPENKYIFVTTHGPQDRQRFAITPNDPNWTAPPAVITFLEDAKLVWMSPHMHVRGKDMTFTLVYPDGKSQIVLNVPHFDFNWQLGYALAEPVSVTKGTKLIVTGHFDNSPGNKFNPDPNQTVYYGNMVWEEMFAGRTGIIVDKKVDAEKVFKEETPQGIDSASNGG
jgi:hypothetical protein